MSTCDVVEGVMRACDDAAIHTTLISESGAIVGYYSVLLINVLDTARFETTELPHGLPQICPNHRNLIEVAHDVLKNLQEVSMPSTIAEYNRLSATAMSLYVCALWPSSSGISSPLLPVKPLN